MRVWSETTGTVTLAMEDLSSIPPGAGATRYIDDTQDVTGGQWNDVTFAFPAANATGDEVNTNYNQLVIKTDEGNTLYVDEIVMDGAEVIPAPSVPTDLVANGAFDDDHGLDWCGCERCDSVIRVT